MEILIIEQSGWSKPIKLEKAIIRIGSALTNDIQLDIPQIAPLHLQVFQSSIASPRVLNLAQAVTLQSAGLTSQLLPFTTHDIQNGDEILLGSYQLFFKLPAASGLVRPSKVIDASLAFSDAVIRPHLPTMGLLTIKNNGDKDACQFRVDLSGLPVDCYQIDPVPLLYPGAQEEVRLRLYHKTTHPLAGFLLLSVVISASQSYPGEEVLLQQRIYVEPVAKQILAIKDDLQAPSQVTVPVENLEQRLSQMKELVTAESPGVGAVAPTPEAFPLSSTVPQPTEATVPPVRLVKTSSEVLQNIDLSKLKVVHGSADEFWDV
jgi:hypothetical protein